MNVYLFLDQVCSIEITSFGLFRKKQSIRWLNTELDIVYGTSDKFSRSHFLPSDWISNNMYAYHKVHWYEKLGLSKNSVNSGSDEVEYAKVDQQSNDQCDLG